MIWPFIDTKLSWVLSATVDAQRSSGRTILEKDEELCVIGNQNIRTGHEPWTLI